MSQITSADVLLIAPELTEVTAGQWAAILEDVYTEVVVANWGQEAKANRAAKYLAAHLAALTQAGRGGAGAVQSESVGDVSTTYVVTQAQDASDLDGTSYGKLYKRLLKLSFAGAWGRCS